MAQTTMMTTTRAIANDIGAAPISDNSCATPSNHSGMVVFPQSDRIRRYLRPESYFSTLPSPGTSHASENDFTPWRAKFSLGCCGRLLHRTTELTRQVM